MLVCVLLCLTQQKIMGQTNHFCFEAQEEKREQVEGFYFSFSHKKLLTDSFEPLQTQSISTVHCVHSRKNSFTLHLPQSKLNFVQLWPRCSVSTLTQPIDASNSSHWAEGSWSLRKRSSLTLLSGSYTLCSFSFLLLTSLDTARACFLFLLLFLSRQTQYCSQQHENWRLSAHHCSLFWSHSCFVLISVMSDTLLSVWRGVTPLSVSLHCICWSINTVETTEIWFRSLKSDFS